MEQVSRDIGTWYDEYTVDGIFVDQVSNRWPSEGDSEEQVIRFYRQIIDYVLDDKGFDQVVLNPGSAYFEEMISSWYGNSRVMVVVFENTQRIFQMSNCSDGLWSAAQGSFSSGPWCPYVPDWDGIEILANLMNDNVITAVQSAVLIYNATVSAADTAASIDYAVQANVGWFYVTDVWGWYTTPNDTVMNALVDKILSL